MKGNVCPSTLVSLSRSSVLLHFHGSCGLRWCLCPNAWCYSLCFFFTMVSAIYLCSFCSWGTICATFLSGPKDHRNHKLGVQHLPIQPYFGKQRYNQKLFQLHMSPPFFLIVRSFVFPQPIYHIAPFFSFFDVMLFLQFMIPVSS